MHLEIDFFKPRLSRHLIPYDLDVFKYQSPDFNRITRVREDDFSLDIIDMAYYTARTLCSYNLDHQELYIDVIASLMSHINFIDSSQSNLLLRESRYKRLRDFSKSSRIGELAQGINAMFVSNRLKFPYIIDFHLAKVKTKSSFDFQTTGKSPDFVIVDSTLKKIGLFESKGNMNGNVTRDLQNALVQIDSVSSAKCIDAKVPISTRFQDDNGFSRRILRKKRKSSINYGLFENECSESKDTSLLRKLHYASWFYLVGDFERVNSILNDGTIAPIAEENDPIYVLDRVTDKGNPIFWVKKPLSFTVSNKPLDLKTHLFITSRYFYEDKFRIGIYKNVIDSITNPSESNTAYQLPEGTIDYLKKYPDGTLLYLKYNR